MTNTQTLANLVNAKFNVLPTLPTAMYKFEGDRVVVYILQEGVEDTFKRSWDSKIKYAPPLVRRR